MPYVPRLPPPSHYGVVNACGELHHLAGRPDGVPDTEDEARRLAGLALGARPVEILAGEGWALLADLVALAPDGHGEPGQRDQH